MLGKIDSGGEGADRGWDGWMALLTQWIWIWISSGSWWWTGRPGVLQSMGSQRVGHDWATELNWTEAVHWGCLFSQRTYQVKWLAFLFAYLMHDNGLFVCFSYYSTVFSVQATYYLGVMIHLSFFLFGYVVKSKCDKWTSFLPDFNGSILNISSLIF